LTSRAVIVVVEVPLVMLARLCDVAATAGGAAGVGVAARVVAEVGAGSMTLVRLGRGEEGRDGGS